MSRLLVVQRMSGGPLDVEAVVERARLSAMLATIARWFSASSDNNGFGISVGPETNANLVVKNPADGDALFDLNAFPRTTNLWNDNNRCGAQGGAMPPFSVNPAE